MSSPLSPFRDLVDGLSPEQRLLLTLSRVDLSPNSREVASALHAPLDWTHLIEQAVQHSVLPLVWTRLSAHAETTPDAPVPHSALEQMRLCYLAGFRKGLQIRGECSRIVHDLIGAGVAALAFKGPVVAEMAYGDPNLRTCTDLDVFIRTSDVPQALEALREMRFEPRNALPPSYGDRWSTYLPHHQPHGNANGYARDGGTPGALHLDLHWGFASRYFLLPWNPEVVFDRSQPVSVAGTPVPTFSDADTLLFLCLHAAKDHYHRLRLIRDIAGLLKHRPDLDAEAALEQARSIRSTRMLTLGVTLAHVLLGAPLPPVFREQVFRERVMEPRTAALVRRAVPLLFASRRGLGGILQRSRFHLAVRDRRRDALGTVLYQTELSLRTFLNRTFASDPVPADRLQTGGSR